MLRESNNLAARRKSTRQTDLIRDVMLSAGECDTWLTLEELARLTQYPPASISAQLRHLRKPRFGSFVVEKRPRQADRLVRSAAGGPVWEYLLLRAKLGKRARKSRVTPRSAGRGVRQVRGV